MHSFHFQPTRAPAVLMPNTYTWRRPSSEVTPLLLLPPLPSAPPSSSRRPCGFPRSAAHLADSLHPDVSMQMQSLSSAAPSHNQLDSSLAMLHARRAHSRHLSGNAQSKRSAHLCMMAECGASGASALVAAKCCATNWENPEGARCLAGVPSTKNFPRNTSRPRHSPHTFLATSMLLLCRPYVCPHLDAG